MNNRVDIEQVLSQMRAMSVEAQGRGRVDQSTDMPSFGDLLRQSIDQVNATNRTAEQMTKSFELGEGSTDLAQVMVAVQKSSVAFEAMVQVRNKLLEAYKDVMNMPI